MAFAKTIAKGIHGNIQHMEEERARILSILKVKIRKNQVAAYEEVGSCVARYVNQLKRIDEAISYLNANYA